MSEAKGNGHDPLTLRMVEVLERIEAEIHGLRVEMNERFIETHARIDALKTITENAHRHVHERIDEAHEDTIANTDRLTGRPDGVIARIERLEAAVFKKTGT